MLPLPIKNSIQAFDNILLFWDNIKSEGEMQQRLSRVTSWYCYKQGKEFIFGPSKFIGYEGISFETYYEYYDDGMSGTETEPVLRTYSEIITPHHPLFNEVSDQLSRFLAIYGKRPKKTARINLLLSEKDVGAGTVQTSAIDLLLTAYESLSSGQKLAFRKAIG